MRDRIMLWGDQLPDIRLFDDRFDRLIENHEPTKVQVEFAKTKADT